MAAAVTALYCPACGRRCGSAEVLPDSGGDLVHITTYNVKRRGSLPGLPVHVTRGRTLRLSDPNGWPLTWRCEVCRDATNPSWPMGADWIDVTRA